MHAATLAVQYPLTAQYWELGAQCTSSVQVPLAGAVALDEFVEVRPPQGVGLLREVHVRPQVVDPEVARAAGTQRLNQVFGDTAEAEAAHEDGGSVGNERDRRVGARKHLVHAAIIEEMDIII